MDPALVAKRRSTVFQRIQFELTKGDVIRKRLSPGKFPTSSVGIVKIIALLLLLCAAIAFLTVQTCPNTSDWYSWLYPLATCLGSITTIIFYAVFTFGLVLKYPAFWFITDILISIIVAIFVIIVAIMTMQDCPKDDSSYKVPGPLGISGSIFLLISGAGLYIMYRNKEEITVKGIQNQPGPAVGARRQKINSALNNDDIDVEV